MSFATCAWLSLKAIFCWPSLCKPRVITAGNLSWTLCFTVLQWAWWEPLILANSHIDIHVEVFDRRWRVPQMEHHANLLNGATNVWSLVKRVAMTIVRQVSLLTLKFSGISWNIQGRLGLSFPQGPCSMDWETRIYSWGSFPKYSMFALNLVREQQDVGML